MNAPLSLVDDLAAIPQLRRFWAGKTETWPPRNVEPLDWALDRLLIDGLGLGLHDTLNFNPPEHADWRFPAADLHWDTSLAPPIPL